jgi:hypothetical protein
VRLGEEAIDAVPLTLRRARRGSLLDRGQDVSDLRGVQVEVRLDREDRVVVRVHVTDRRQERVGQVREGDRPDRGLELRLEDGRGSERRDGGLQLVRGVVPLAPAGLLQDANDLPPLVVDPDLRPHHRVEVVVGEVDLRVDERADLLADSLLVEVLDAVHLGEAVEVEHADRLDQVRGEVARVGRAQRPGRIVVGPLARLLQDPVDRAPLGGVRHALADPPHHEVDVREVHEQARGGEVQALLELEQERIRHLLAAVRGQGITRARIAQRDREHPEDRLLVGALVLLPGLAEPDDLLPGVRRGEPRDLGAADHELALGPVEPLPARAVLPGAEQGASRQARSIDARGELQEDVHPIGDGRLARQVQEPLVIEREVPARERVGEVARVPEQPQEREEEREVGPVDAASAGAGGAHRVIDERRELFQIMGALAQEPAPVPVGLVVSAVVAELLGERLGDRQQVSGGALVDRHVARIERRLNPSGLARAIAFDDRGIRKLSRQATTCFHAAESHLYSGVYAFSRKPLAGVKLTARKAGADRRRRSRRRRAAAPPAAGAWPRAGRPRRRAAARCP